MSKVTARQRFTMLTGHHNVLRCTAKTQRESSLTYSHIIIVPFSEENTHENGHPFCLGLFQFSLGIIQ